MGRSRRGRQCPRLDLNLAPTNIKPRILTTAIDLDDATALPKLALEVAGYFELAVRQTHRIATQVGKAVAQWRKVAAKMGVSAPEIDPMASVVEHDGLKAVLRFHATRSRLPIDAL